MDCPFIGVLSQKEHQEKARWRFVVGTPSFIISRSWLRCGFATILSVYLHAQVRQRTNTDDPRNVDEAQHWNQWSRTQLALNSISPARVDSELGRPLLRRNDLARLTELFKWLWKRPYIFTQSQNDVYILYFLLKACLTNRQTVPFKFCF